MIDQRKMVDVVNENFERYAGNVILDRAICDVRDMLKPSARMLIYSQMAITYHTSTFNERLLMRIFSNCHL